MSIRLEHANLAVRDLDAVLQFLRVALPEFVVRGSGRTDRHRRWVHIGTADSYLALTEVSQDPLEPWVPYGNRPGLNHLGFVVSDVAAISERLSAAGYRNSTVPNHHPHRTRAYFFDPEGNDWEFVEYHTDDALLRNDYVLPD